MLNKLTSREDVTLGAINLIDNILIYVMFIDILQRKI